MTLRGKWIHWVPHWLQSALKAEGCGAKMIVPFVHCRSEGGTGWQDKVYRLLQNTLHCHTEAPLFRRQWEISNCYWRRSALLSFVSYLFGQQILSLVIREAWPKAVRKGLQSLASLSFSLMQKEPSDEGETGMFLEILWSTRSISKKYSWTNKQENTIQRDRAR